MIQGDLCLMVKVCLGWPNDQVQRKSTTATLHGPIDPTFGHAGGGPNQTNVKSTHPLCWRTSTAPPQNPMPPRHSKEKSCATAVWKIASPIYWGDLRAALGCPGPRCAAVAGRASSCNSIVRKLVEIRASGRYFVAVVLNLEIGKSR